MLLTLEFLAAFASDGEEKATRRESSVLFPEPRPMTARRGSRVFVLFAEKLEAPVHQTQA